VDFMSVCSPCALERELRLEVELANASPPAEPLACPDTRANRDRRAAAGWATADRMLHDEPRQPVVRRIGVGIVNVHAGEYRRLRVGEVVAPKKLATEPDEWATGAGTGPVVLSFVTAYSPANVICFVRYDTMPSSRLR